MASGSVVSRKTQLQHDGIKYSRSVQRPAVGLVLHVRLYGLPNGWLDSGMLPAMDSVVFDRGNS